jgi:hypothetical protein
MIFGDPYQYFSFSLLNQQQREVAREERGQPQLLHSKNWLIFFFLLPQNCLIEMWRCLPLGLNLILFNQNAFRREVKS